MAYPAITLTTFRNVTRNERKKLGFVTLEHVDEALAGVMKAEATKSGLAPETRCAVKLVLSSNTEPVAGTNRKISES